MTGPENIDATARAMAQRVAEAYGPSKVVRIPPECGAEGGPPVDLLVVKDTPEPFDARRERIRQLCAEVDPSIGVDAIVLTPAEVSQRLRLGDAILQELLQYGEVLYETPEGDRA